MIDFGAITDWYIPEDLPESAIIYPGAIRIPTEMARTATELRNKARKASGLSKDYRIEHDGFSFRGHRQTTITGILHVLRRTSIDVPDLLNLGLPEEIRRILASEKLGPAGGLVLICGEPGQGKSTTMAALVMHRLRKMGGFCLTVEDPVEFMMHGDHPSYARQPGKCIQVPADNQSFAGDLRDALRCYPSNIRGSMLMVGEIRDSETAAHVLRAAVNGQMVFATMHAGTRIGALERMIGMAIDSMGPEEARGLLSNSLRAITVQRLTDGKLSAEAMFSLNGDSPVGSRIKAGNFQMLSSEIAQQDTWLRNAMLVNRIFQETTP